MSDLRDKCSCHPGWAADRIKELQARTKESNWCAAKNTDLAAEVCELQAQITSLQELCEGLLAEKQKRMTAKDALSICAEREASEQT